MQCCIRDSLAKLIQDGLATELWRYYGELWQWLDGMAWHAAAVNHHDHSFAAAAAAPELGTDHRWPSHGPLSHLFCHHHHHHTTFWKLEIVEMVFLFRWIRVQPCVRSILIPSPSHSTPLITSSPLFTTSSSSSYPAMQRPQCRGPFLSFLLCPHWTLPFSLLWNICISHIYAKIISKRDRSAGDPSFLSSFSTLILKLFVFLIYVKIFPK